MIPGRYLLLTYVCAEPCRGFHGGRGVERVLGELCKITEFRFYGLGFQFSGLGFRFYVRLGPKGARCKIAGCREFTCEKLRLTYFLSEWLACLLQPLTLSSWFLHVLLGRGGVLDSFNACYSLPRTIHPPQTLPTYYEIPHYGEYLTLYSEWEA